MAVSARNSLNPNADPFLYPTLSVPFAKRESVAVPVPISNVSHQFYHWKTNMMMQPQQLPVATSQAVGWSPVHGYVCYVEPTSRWQYQYSMPDCYDVNSLGWWSCSAGFGCVISQPENSVGERNVGSDLTRISKMGQRTSQRNFEIEKWIEMKTKPREMGVIDDAILLSPTPGEGMSLEATTVMIKNIPNQFRRRDLLNILDEHCRLENRSYDHNFSAEPCRSEYDFVYLPMDFRRFWFERKISNLGYAFVNFTSAAAASKFCRVYHRREWKVTLNKKVCEVNRAKIQGIKALKEAFRNKIFWCHSNQYLPVTLEPPSDGCRSYKAISIGKRIPVIPPKPMKKCS